MGAENNNNNNSDDAMKSATDERVAWIMTLKGHPFDLGELVPLMVGGAIHVAMRHDGDQGAQSFHLVLPIDLVGMDPDAVQKAARQALQTLNGIASLRVPGYRGAGLDENMHTIDSAGQRRDAVVRPLMGELRMRGLAPTVVVGGQARPAPAEGDGVAIFGAAMTDHRIASALELVGHSTPTWPQLYVAFELVRASEGRGMYAWVSEAETDRFRHTADNFDVLGAQARHGPKNTDPPKNPMSHDEALAYVHRLVGAWISHQVSKRSPSTSASSP